MVDMRKAELTELDRERADKSIKGSGIKSVSTTSLKGAYAAMDGRYRGNRKLSSEGGGTGVSYRDPLTPEKRAMLEQVKKIERDNLKVRDRFTVVCPLCNAKKSSKHALRRHMKWEHDFG